jgi:hypothetical protein
MIFLLYMLSGWCTRWKDGTPDVEFQGRHLETQSAQAEDATGRIKLQLWEDQIGMLSYGKSYRFTSLTTREFDGELFLTTTKETEIEEIPPLPGLGDISPHEEKEEPMTSLYGVINRAEVAVSRSCGNSTIWQTEFNPKN